MVARQLFIETGVDVSLARKKTKQDGEAGKYRDREVTVPEDYFFNRAQHLKES